MDMQIKSDSQRLADRLNELKAAGYVDVKFCLRNQGDTDVEQACAEALEMLSVMDTEFELVEPVRPS